MDDILGGDAIGRVRRGEWKEWSRTHETVEALDPAAVMDITCEWIVACVRGGGRFS
jgi:hypothetical protein